MKYEQGLSMNKIIRPESSVTEFLHFAAENNFAAIELRNDLPDPRVLGNESAETIKQTIVETGIKVLTINALQRFNDPKLVNEKKIELSELITTAKSINCPMIVLCPVNDPDDNRNADQQHNDLVSALKEYAPLFQSNNIIGLLEPLGFPICSLRTKKQAVSAIKETGLESVYKITHDTFHHYLSEEAEFFPAETGLLHISGVLPGKAKEDITDDDRILVTPEDCMNNREQLKDLTAGGYKGYVSYEAFSPEVQKMNPSGLKKNIRESVSYLFS